MTNRPIRRPAPATVFINNEEIRESTGVAMTIGHPARPAVVFPTTGGMEFTGRVRLFKRGHARHVIRKELDWWRVFTALHARKSRTHYPRSAVVKSLPGR